jgi:hypothetical protein
VQPPLTAADREVLAAIAGQEVRKPGQRVSVHFENPEGPGEDPEDRGPEPAPDDG